MDARLEVIVSGLIRSERSRRVLQTARAVAQAIEPIPIGNGRRTLVIDAEAAKEYEARAASWFSILKGAMADVGFGWTPDRGQKAAQFLAHELVTDWEELVELIRRNNASRPHGARLTELEAAKERVRSVQSHEIDLLVLSQERSRLELDEQIGAPRYAAVRAALLKARDLFRSPEPDLPNACKEAVSAVEQLARIVVQDESCTLGEGIKKLRSTNRVPAPLLKGLEEVWGWTSDTPSVRHGASAKAVVDTAGAKYVLTMAEAALSLLLAIDTA